MQTRGLNCHTASALGTLAARLEARTILVQETAARTMSLCYFVYVGEKLVCLLQQLEF